MKIGIMVSRQSPQAGGGFTYDQEITQALCRLRGESAHEFFLIGYQPERPSQFNSTGLGWLSLHRARALRRRQKLAGFWSRIERRLSGKKKRTPLDYENYPSFAESPVDLIFYPTPQIRPISDIPYITTMWDSAHRRTPFFPEVGARGEWEAREKSYRNVLGRAAYVIATNSRGREEVIHYFGLEQERVRAFPLPTPSFALEEGATEFRPKSVMHLGIKGDFFFYPAQFWPHKNHACLLHALKILADQHGQKPQLVFTGSDKGNRPYVKSLAGDLGLANQIVWPGFVPREDLVTLYRQSISLLFPSFFGPENLPPLEAFGLGCPVIASQIPGHDEQLGDAAILADPTAPEAWADAMHSLQSDPAQRETLIQRGRERALRYTPDDFARDLFKLMDEFAAYRRCWP